MKHYSHVELDEMLIHLLEPNADSEITKPLLIEENLNRGDESPNSNITSLSYETGREMMALNWTRRWSWPICPFDMPLPTHSYRHQVPEGMFKPRVGCDYVRPAFDDHVTFQDFAFNGIHAFQRSVNRKELKLSYYELDFSNPSHQWREYYSRRLVGYKWWTRKVEVIVKNFNIPYIGKES